MQVTQNVHALKIKFPSTGEGGRPVERFVYVYFIYGSEICMIDGGVSSTLPEILGYLKNTGRNVAEIKLLVHTHCHPDHIGSSPAIIKLSGCRVAAHEQAKPWMEDISLQYRMRPTGTFFALVSGPVAVDRVLNDGDVLDLNDGQMLRVLHTPGHSTDSLSFFYEPDGVLFTGDTVPVPGERPVYDNVTALVESIRKLQAVKGVEIHCASWLEPQRGNAAAASTEKALRYIQQLHEVVRRTKAETPAMDRAGLCDRILARLDLPKIPNVVKTIESHLDAANIENLLEV